MTHAITLFNITGTRMLFHTRYDAERKASKMDKRRDVHSVRIYIPVNKWLRVMIDEQGMIHGLENFA